MKKKILIILSATTFTLFSLTGCNKQIIDLNYNYNYATILLQNGEVVEGKVESWKDYEGEQIQVKINGVTYLTSSYNCTLMKK